MTGELVPFGPGVEVSPTSLAVTDPSMPYEAFESVVRGVAVVGDSARWWLGDLLLFGEGKYGEQYAQAIDAARLSERQLGEYRYVCQQVARSRRRENLPFSYHREVAPLEPREQDDLLRRAEREEWSRERLREEIRDRRAVEDARGRQTVLPSRTEAVDAARGLVDTRETLATLAEGLDAETSERLGVPAALRGVEEASRAVRRLSPAVSVVEAARRAVESGVEQTNIADPAFIVPSGAWKTLAAAVAAYDQKGER